MDRKSTNLGKGKRLDEYILNYFNSNNIEPKDNYNWLLNNQPIIFYWCIYIIMESE